MDLIEKAVKAQREGKGESIVERAVGNLRVPTKKKASAAVAEAPQPLSAEAGAAESSTPEERKRSRHRAFIDLDHMRARNMITPDGGPTQLSEEYRIIKRRLLLNAFSRDGTDIQNGNLILVSSAKPGEGKTFCAINLAMSIASERDLTVLLVDADFSKPEILRRLGVTDEGKGLIDVVADQSLDMSDCLIRTNIENFSILPAGRPHHLSTELIASERMGGLVEEIAKRYPDRVIIFDSSPALASSAASVLALHVGQVLFIVEAERTRESDIKEGLSLLSACPNINLVLNKSRINFGAKKFGSYYGYGYS